MLQAHDGFDLNLGGVNVQVALVIDLHDLVLADITKPAGFQAAGQALVTPLFRPLPRKTSWMRSACLERIAALMTRSDAFPRPTIYSMTEFVFPFRRLGDVQRSGMPRHAVGDDMSGCVAVALTAPQ